MASEPAAPPSALLPDAPAELAGPLLDPFEEQPSPALKTIEASTQRGAEDIARVVKSMGWV